MSTSGAENSLLTSPLLILAGAALGLPVAIAAARLISSRLYGLKPADPMTIAAAIILLTAVATLAG